MKIITEGDYRTALERANILRSKGMTAKDNPELAEVEGAIAAYEALPDQPGVSKGRPPRNT
jgi:hypothetical protein